jgi:serine/threonine-protein kinase
MGEVYRATDTRLGREVALKVLPEAFAADPDRLARFEREAKLLASLNHPGIAHLYGFENGTLADGTSSHVLVLELVEGEDLAERLGRGPIPVDETIAIAEQVAEALEEAHEKGIVHRDLKPANVKVTPDGKVKVLDFGLAKAWSGDGPGATSSADLSQSPTLAHTGTAAGIILGTAAYMSPEQARGRAVDRRADVWAFGVLVYEMLTGRRLFEGETVSDVLAAVLTREPDWQALPPGTPPGLRRVLRRCLERDPRRRLRDIADARPDLEEAPPPGPDERPAPEPSRGTRATGRWVGGVVAGILLGALAGGVAVVRLGRAPGDRVVRLAFPLTTGGDAIQQTSGIAVSPDGTRVVFRSSGGGRRGLFIRSLDTLEPQPIPDSEGGYGPCFSPDGQSVAFFSIFGGARRTGLVRARIEGGTPTLVVELPSSAVSGLTFTCDWPEAGHILLAGPSPVVQRVSAAGGEPAAVTALDAARGETSHVQPHRLPGSQGLLCVAVSAGGRPDVLFARGDGTPGRVLVEGATSPRFAPTGHLLFVKETTLFAVPFDPARGELAGEPAPVVEGLMVGVYGSFRRAHYDLSANGTLVSIAASASGREARLVLVDRQGKATPAFDPVGDYLVPRVSPDGDRVAYAATSPATGRREVWVGDLKRGTRTRMPFEKGSATDPVFTRDGRAITFTGVGEDGLWHIYSAPIDGSRAPDVLIRGRDRSRVSFPKGWLPGGTGLLLHTIAGSDDLELWRLATGATETVLAAPSAEIEPSLSPDGRFLAYVSDESGEREVYVRPLQGTSRGVQVSSTGGDEPVWSPRGDELFFRRGAQLLAVPFASGVPGAPALLFEGRFETDPYNNDATNYDVTDDGRRFVMVQRVGDRDTSLQQLDVVLGGHEVLRQLARP